MIQCLGKYSPIPTQKAILKIMGMDLGPCRLPLATLTEQQISDLKNNLEEVDFFTTLEKLSLKKIGETNGVMR